MNTENTSRILKLVSSRSSCRNYQEKAVPAEVISRLEAKLKTATLSLSSLKMFFKLIFADENCFKALKEYRNYGIIRCAPLLISGKIEKSPLSCFDFGYAMQKIVVEAQSYGLDSCWLSGELDKTFLKETLQPQTDEIIPAAAAAGYGAETRTAAVHERKPLSGLLFFAENADSVLPPSLSEIMEAVRLAPSSSNRQPVRIFMENDSCFSFFIERTPDYENLKSPVRLQDLDAGAAMANFELAAADFGAKVKWSREEGKQLNAFDYVYTAKLYK